MRRLAEVSRIRRLMRALGRAAKSPGRVLFTGGVTAVLTGWRASTVDVDLVFVPDHDLLLRALPDLKERLELNVEIASPAHFLPELPGWQERSRFIGREGLLDFFHYDPYSQALAKLERGHGKDLLDVEAMLSRGWVERDELLRLFEQIEPELYRFPAIDPPSFRRAVEAVVAEG
jgi:hypothetical protein